MSRIGNNPVSIPKGAEVKIDGQHVAVKGPKGEMSLNIHESVGIEENDGVLTFKAESSQANAMTGTMRSLVDNMVNGVTEGFEKKLTLIGVGYRAEAKGQNLNLALGFSHPVDYAVPEGVKVDTPTQTEIIVSGADKQKVGQVAAEIRAFRPPEPYKGKGVRYSDEYVARKEAKKA